MSIPYFVPDTSPIFSYSPCVNCATKGSWQSAYTARGDGYDVTFHQATDWNVSVAFNVSGECLLNSTPSTEGEAKTREDVDVAWMVSIMEFELIFVVQQHRVSTSIQERPIVADAIRHIA